MLNDLLNFLTLLVDALVDFPLLKIGLSFALMVLVISIIITILEV